MTARTDSALVIRRQAFHSILADEPVDAASIGRATGENEQAVAGTLERLAAKGAARLDAERRVVGIGGVSLEPSRHRMRLGEKDLYTWCAIDAVGIPAALERDAEVRTSCPHCSADIVITIEAGRARSDLDPLFFLPTIDFENVYEEFCPLINAFCVREHLGAWQAANGNVPGRTLTLAEVARLGAEWWGWAR